MIQLTDEQYGEIMDTLGAARQTLMHIHGQAAEPHVLLRVRHLLGVISEELKDGTIVQEERHG